VHAQIAVNSSSNTYIGNYSSSDNFLFKKYNFIIRGYPGVYWQRNLYHQHPYEDRDTTYFFQLDARPRHPCIAGNGNSVVFYNSKKNKFETIIVRNVYKESSLQAIQQASQIENPLNLIKETKLANCDENNDSDSICESNIIVGKPSLQRRSNNKKTSNEISLLTASIQFLQNQIIDQYSRLNQITQLAQDSINKEYLSKITPLSSTQAVKLNCFIPSTTNNAFVLISTMNNKNVRTIHINKFGQSEIDIEKGLLNAGIYRCTLFIDGEISKSEYITITK